MQMSIYGGLPYVPPNMAQFGHALAASGLWPDFSYAPFAKLSTLSTEFSTAFGAQWRGNPHLSPTCKPQSALYSKVFHRRKLCTMWISSGLPTPAMLRVEVHISRHAPWMRTVLHVLSFSCALSRGPHATMIYVSVIYR